MQLRPVSVLEGLVMRIALAIVMFCICTTAKASVVFFNTTPGDQGQSHAYMDTTSTFTITATAYPTISAAPFNHLYGKNLGGDENGLGLTGDPSGKFEIWKTANTNAFIQLDLLDIINKLGNNVFYTIQMNSTTNGESWQIYSATGSAFSGTTTLLKTGSDELSYVYQPKTRYLDFFALNVGNNVLIYDVSFAPEPGTVLLMGGGLGLLALMRRRLFSRRS